MQPAAQLPINNRDQALLTASQAYCRRIVNNSGSNFKASFSFLKPDAQRAMHTLYAFARLVDDVADDTHLSEAAAPGAGRALREWLRLIREATESNVEDLNGLVTRVDESGTITQFADNGDHAFLRVTPAVYDLINRSAVVNSLEAIIQGAEFDLNPASRIVEINDLDRYCDWVASSVGAACLHIWQSNTPSNIDYAVHCGRAFQLTNILRDVAEDAARGRIYLPECDREEFGCSEANWLARNPDGDWKAVMQRNISLAFDHYEASYRLIQHLPFEAGRMFSLMWHAYRALLIELRANLDIVWKQRIRLSYAQKTRLYLQHAITPLYLAKNRN